MINDVLFWIVGILWFVDEIETLIDLKKFGIEREKNPIARFFVEHGPMVFTVFKIISFSIFVFLIKTIQLFDTSIGFFKKNNKIDIENTGDRSDQNYINKKLQQKRFHSLRIQLLKKELFPNGWYWRQHCKNIDPYIVHYNCIKGIINKENDMKKYNHWLV